MAEQPDWARRGVIAAWVLGIPTLAVAIITYVRPPDPANPMKFDFLSKSVSVPPWIALLIAIAIISVTVIATQRITATAVHLPVVQPQAAENSVDTTNIFEIHLPSLDVRPGPGTNIKCPAQLRFSLKNLTKEPIHVLPLKWVTGPGNVSVQCGAAPYPGQVYEPGMQELGFFYQLETYPGSWQKNQWQMKGKDDKEHDERKDLLVQPGWTFRVWIGLNPCVPDNVLKERLAVNQLGTLIIPLLVGSRSCEWKAEF